jgi:hypothetical protein
MLRPTLIGDPVVEGRQPRQKRLLTSTWVMQALHRQPLPFERIMGLIQQGAGDRHLRVCEPRIPPGFLLLAPAPDTLAMSCTSRVGDMIGKVP